VSCQETKVKRGFGPGTATPQDIAHRRWARWFIDLIPYLHRTAREKDCMLFVTDAVTRQHLLLDTHSNSTTIELAFLLLNRVVSLFGPPEEMAFDSDSKFSSEDMEDFCRVLRIATYRVTARHQRANPAERYVQICVRILRTYAYNDPTNWDLWLGLCNLAMNSHFNKDIGMSPNEASFGWRTHPIAGIPVVELESVRNIDFRQMIEHQKGILAIIRDVMNDAVYESKFDYDHCHKDQKFKVRDEVWLDISNLRRFGTKLAARWVGPIRVREIVLHHGEHKNNYLLDLPASLKRLSPVIHTSFLRPYYPPLAGQPSHDRPGPILGHGDDIYELDAIAEHHFDKRRKKWMFHVTWK
jgi:hypothetical protein